MATRGVLITASLLVFLFALAAFPAIAEEDMPVTCYRDGARIGTVTVFDWKTAAATCNTVLYDCKGRCVGCFRDSDYISDVCMDIYGREFLR